jgi:hypothetical protein
MVDALNSIVEVLSCFVEVLNSIVTGSRLVIQAREPSC